MSSTRSCPEADGLSKEEAVAEHFDMVVIGSGPGGQRAAIQAAKLGKRVAVIERSEQLGGAALRAGTIPSKAAREAALVLTGAAGTGLLRDKRVIRRDVTVAEVFTATRDVSDAQLRVVEDAFARNAIKVLWGQARFADGRTVVVEAEGGSTSVTADRFVIATGTRAARPGHVPFNDRTILTTDTLSNVEKFPRSMLVVGGGVIGTEMACILAALDVEVTLVEGRTQLLGFVDREIVEAFQTAVRRLGVTLRLGEKVHAIVEVPRASGDELVQATLESGKELRAETLLYAVGRQGSCKDLGLEKVGIAYDDRERLRVDDHYRTSVPHIYAVGDVIGFPALAATAMEQGRLAACHAFGAPARSLPSLLPYGIYAIPEISMVGATEETLTESGVPYESGVARYEELARGRMVGDRDGLVKLLVHQTERRLLGVHCIGTSATELVHIGQMVMAYGGTVDDLVDHVFNYPTLAEAYKVAAHNAVNKLALR
jgi:NAD(P) transhydrogenase